MINRKLFGLVSLKVCVLHRVLITCCKRPSECEYMLRVYGEQMLASCERIFDEMHVRLVIFNVKSF